MEMNRIVVNHLVWGTVIVTPSYSDTISSNNTLIARFDQLNGNGRASCRHLTQVPPDTLLIHYNKRSMELNTLLDDSNMYGSCNITQMFNHINLMP